MTPFPTLRSFVPLALAAAVAVLPGRAIAADTHSHGEEEMIENARLVGQMLAFAGRVNQLEMSEDEREVVIRGLLDCLQAGETPPEVRANFSNAMDSMQGRFNELTNLSDEPAPFSETIAFTIGHMVAQFSELAGYAFSEQELDALSEGFASNLQLDSPPESLMSGFNRISHYLDHKEEAYVAAEQAAKAAGNAAFFEDLAGREGVQSNDQGLFWEVHEPGEGAPPGPADSVTVHYKGTLVDGTVFDSSYERGEPATFPMNGVIPGFSGGLSKIAPGGKVTIYIPSALGYGQSPPPASPIGPGDTLIFECELISVERATPPPAAARPGESSIGN